jgi:hypothetical protein
VGGGSLIFVSGQGPIEAGGATVDGDDTGRLGEMVQARRRHLRRRDPIARARE